MVRPLDDGVGPIAPVDPSVGEGRPSEMVPRRCLDELVAKSLSSFKRSCDSRTAIVQLAERQKRGGDCVAFDGRGRGGRGHCCACRTSEQRRDAEREDNLLHLCSLSKRECCALRPQPYTADRLLLSRLKGKHGAHREEGCPSTISWRRSLVALGRVPSAPRGRADPRIRARRVARFELRHFSSSCSRGSQIASSMHASKLVSPRTRTREM